MLRGIILVLVPLARREKSEAIVPHPGGWLRVGSMQHLGAAFDYWRRSAGLWPVAPGPAASCAPRE